MRWRGRMWPILWAVLGAYLVIRTGLRDRGVITDHLEFGRRVLFGEELYAPFAGQPLHPPYPPSFGLLTAPFALLPERLARFAWGLLQVGCIWVIALRVRDLVRESLPAALERIHWLYLFVAVLGSRYVLRDTHGGGGNLINLALILSAVHYARRDREIAGGLLLGLSLATKPVAVLILPWLWLVGHRKAPGVAVLTAAGCLGLSLLLLRQGLAPFLMWFDGSVAYATMPDLFATPAHGFPPFTWMNQCLRCCLARFLGDVPAELAAQVPGFSPGLGLGAGTVRWITQVVGAALVLGVFGWLYAKRREPATRKFGLAAVLALSLLMSPISWKAHHVALIPAFALLGGMLVYGHRWVWVFATVYFGFCVVGEQFVGKDFKNVQQSYYFTTFGTLAVLGLCLYVTGAGARFATPARSAGTRPPDPGSPA